MNKRISLSLIACLLLAALPAGAAESTQSTGEPAPAPAQPVAPSVTSTPAPFVVAERLDDLMTERPDSRLPETLRDDPPTLPRLGQRQEGLASWYGPGFHGKRTASGDVFDMYLLTAAHRTLPLSSYLRVTNLANQKSVIVKINDRGPYHSRRLLDLSYAAAQHIGLNSTGRVSVEPIENANKAGSLQPDRPNTPALPQQFKRRGK